MGLQHAVSGRASCLSTGIRASWVLTLLGVIIYFFAVAFYIEDRTLPRSAIAATFGVVCSAGAWFGVSTVVLLVWGTKEAVEQAMEE